MANNLNVSSMSRHENNLVLSLDSNFAQSVLRPTANYGIQPTSFVPHIAPPLIGLGQYAVGQKLTETRRIYVTPSGVRVHTVTEYSSFAQTHQFQAIPPSQPMINFMSLDQIRRSIANSDTAVLNPEPVSVCAPGTFMAQNPHDHNQNLDQNQNPETNQLDTAQVGIPEDQGRVPSNQINTSSDSSEDLQEMDLGDGRTHSLPHQKYGPYTCPKCNSVFTTSQTFAAHVIKYYRAESTEKKQQRQAARSKKKDLRRVHSHGNGLTVPPVTENNVPLNANVRRKKVARGKGKMAGKRVVEDKVREEGHGNTGPYEASTSSPAGMVNKESL
ncbi:unnamed protein product [Dovyalis caffra]|uniref:C2H2-type domain-containing protein n=1 Tax=Dovyalis caffra TaxID=77055 RepID=A0AAV1RUK9_9ROSI|nr:unnamed protein product [Dovyalis caffra]